MTKKELSEIVRSCKQGNDEAFEILYRSFYPMSFRYALSLTHCEADAYDVAQEALLQAHKNIRALKEPELFGVWLRRITFTQCTRIFRKNKHVIYSDSVLSSMESKADLTLDNNPDKCMHFHSDRDLMVYFLGLLPKAQRDVMMLFFFEQLTTKEIAVKLKIAEGTVKSRIFSAKKELCAKIKQYEREEEISLDFESNALLSFLAQGTLFSFLGTSLAKLKPTLVAQAGKAVALITLTSAIGVGSYAIYRQGAQDIVPDAKLQNSVNNQQKLFPPTKLDNQEIKTAQDAYFKIILWSNSEMDIKSATLEQCLELEKMLKALQSYGGYYYEILEKNGWISNFYKFSKINERNEP